LIFQADTALDSAELMPDITYTIKNSSIIELLSVFWLLLRISMPQLLHSTAPAVLLYLSGPAASSVAQFSFFPFHLQAICTLIPFWLEFAGSIRFVYSIWLPLLWLFAGSARPTPALPSFLHFLGQSLLGSFGPIELDSRYSRTRSHFLVVCSSCLALPLILPFRSFQRPVMLSRLRCLPGPS
jgi:hypothetical protein